MRTGGTDYEDLELLNERFREDFRPGDGSGYITGDCVTIDGGRWVKGASQFSFLDRLTPEEWDSMRPKKARA